MADRSGNGHDGQLTGGTWVAAGRFGGGLRLQPGDSVTIPGFPQAMPDWTVSVWIKLSAADVAAFTSRKSGPADGRKDRRWEAGRSSSIPGPASIGSRPRTTWPRPPTITSSSIASASRSTAGCTGRRSSTRPTTASASISGVLLVDGSALPAPILPGEADLNIGRWSQGRAFPLRRDRRLRDLVPRSQRRRGRSDRRQSRARLALTLRAIVEAKKLGLLCSGRRVFLYMGGQLPDAFRKDSPPGSEEACSLSGGAPMSCRCGLSAVALWRRWRARGQDRRRSVRDGRRGRHLQRRPDDVLRVVHERRHRCRRTAAPAATRARSGRCAATGSASARGGLLACGGQCVASNAAHCGSCDMVCGADQGCSNGSCGSCPAGEIQCTDGACVSPTGGTALHCGGCTPCPAGATCNAGACTCGPNQMMCGSPLMCVDVTTSRSTAAAATSPATAPARTASAWGARADGRQRNDGVHAAPADSAPALAAVGGAVGQRGQGSPGAVVGARAQQPRRRGAVRVLRRHDAGRRPAVPVRALRRHPADRDTGDRRRRSAARRATIAPCSGTTASAQTTCAQTFIQAFAKKAYRRPVDSTEVTNLMKRLHAGRDAGLRDRHRAS